MVRYPTLAIFGLATHAACAVAEAAPEPDAPDVGVFFHIPGRNDGGGQLLAARGRGDGKCFKSQIACDSECIDSSFVCCNVGQGQACQEGYSCYSQGCCRNGQTCSGPPKGCTATTKMCDVGCIPKDRTCCNFGDGSSCDSDTVCLSSGQCGRLQSELGPSSDRSGGSPNGPSRSQTPTSSGAPGIIVVSGGDSTASASLKTLSDTAIGASVTSAVSVSSGVYSLGPITTTPGAGDDASPGASSSGKSKPTTGASTSSSSSDKGGAGATLKAPAILAGMLAVAAYVI
ncbi:hypothetical protein PWT90_04821 [Aphanocladium album]|nr:hypothetical protein PWT90_04821 [Aphanocladium album]